jgi:decaprenylphospho-beta-D-erythro-pentofuranosid-2-ulose 2-reductase
MLNKKRRSEKYKNVVLIGSNSEIGLSILSELPLENNSSILLIGRTLPSHVLPQNSTGQIDFFRSDLEIDSDLDELALKITSLDNIDLAIVAAGYLPPEDCDLDVNQIRKSIQINGLGISVALSILAGKMSGQKKGKILFISSVASMRPRIRNFTYGASKKSADFFAQGLFHKYQNTNLRIFILRPGFVFTKLSRDFRPAPFATSASKVATIAVDSLKNPRKIVYAPRILRYVMPILQITPRWLYNLMGK